MKKKKTIILVFFALLLILLIILAYFSFAEQRIEDKAREFGSKYIQEEYAIKDKLTVLNTCNPFFGSGGYHLVLQDTSGTRYYITVFLGPENNLISIDDLTPSVWKGLSELPCEA
ncbi:hypothetical protein NSQ29_08370 [Paenibacillus sp. FSL F4-0236]|uniref:hypothetical protein n=1 Tax=Paenibacillus sp. FSL F4-0236 TaxID=2954731 RepID=UPI0030FBA34E